ncbi:hypothetical protein A0H81_12042 [Grifola frondosa]|uniref:Uncharacterized protein n=1 Tax=Grifola frondosa TaxID=5627 RepID=A0A1C7LZK9_GRIFR|nr:hypothetical protein A0H81_12042 [Grifola frondosa]
MATPDANSPGSQRTSPFAGQVDICGKILRLEIGPDGESCNDLQSEVLEASDNPSQQAFRNVDPDGTWSSYRNQQSVSLISGSDSEEPTDDGGSLNFEVEDEIMQDRMDRIRAEGKCGILCLVSIFISVNTQKCCSMV